MAIKDDNINELPEPTEQVEPIAPIEQQPIDPFAEPEPDPVPISRGKEVLAGFLSGSFLTKAEVRRVYPYLIAIFVLMILYITNVFNMQQLYRHHSRLQQNIKELRARSSTISAIKMNATRQSEITKQLQQRGIELHESLTPPKVLERDNE